MNKNARKYSKTSYQRTNGMVKREGLQDIMVRSVTNLRLSKSHVMKVAHSLNCCGGTVGFQPYPLLRIRRRNSVKSFPKSP